MVSQEKRGYATDLSACWKGAEIFFGNVRRRDWGNSRSHRFLFASCRSWAFDMLFPVYTGRDRAFFHLTSWQNLSREAYPKRRHGATDGQPVWKAITKFPNISQPLSRKYRYCYYQNNMFEYTNLNTLFNIDSFNFKYNGSCTLIITYNHHFVIIYPSMHNCSALKYRINIPADSTHTYEQEGTPSVPQCIVPGERSTPSSGSPLLIKVPAPICQ